jgi:hypothetical protein
MESRRLGHTQNTVWALEGLLIYSLLLFSHHPYSYLQAVIERYREGTKEEFWAEFRDVKGRYLSFTAIVSRLKEEHVEENEHVAKRARLEYGDAFASVFSYRKGSCHITMTDPARIANKYRIIHSQ